MPGAPRHEAGVSARRPPDVLKPGIATAIGSMPHKDPGRAVDLVLEACPDAPCWPQLPALGFQEDMLAQFAEGLPCLEISEAGKTLFFRKPGEHLDQVTDFYEAYLEAESTGRLDRFSISPGHARGLYALAERLSREEHGGRALLKGQITGPLTFALSVKDEEGRPAFFEETLLDVIQKGIAMKALWQVRFLGRYCKDTVIFVDEPILAAFGSSAFINVSRQAVVSSLGALCTQIKAAGALVGSHCCGNTDWSLLVDAGVDIINFDAYAYMESISIYADSLARFFDAGGFLAWGIVPSAHLGRRPDVGNLFEALRRGLALLESRGIPRDLALRRMIVTPSCGLGTLDQATAENALRELSSLSRRVRGELLAS
jgi:methionine synthase II (cobalamin-independent)